jgi:pimeloyl-ACP methyl ester carboxylesterase
VPKASLNGFIVHYQQMGQGHDVVMIHGLFANLAFWYLSVLPLLARNFRVTVYDLRGHGYSGMPRHGYTVSNLATDLYVLLEHIGIEQAHIVGHSFGGAVGLKYAALYPERVRSLTLADARVPSLQPPLPPRNAVRWKILDARLRRAGIEVPQNLPRVAYSFLEELARLRPQRNASDAKTWGTALLQEWHGNSRAMRRWRELVGTTTAAQDLCNAADLTVERIRQVTRPTLAIFGQYSSCIRTLWGLVEHLPNCQKVIVPGVGHLHPIVKPETFVQKLDQFIQGIES